LDVRQIGRIDWPQPGIRVPRQLSLDASNVLEFQEIIVRVFPLFKDRKIRSIAIGFGGKVCDRLCGEWDKEIARMREQKRRSRCLTLVPYLEKLYMEI
jgi:hypothetical protein